jgi:hypothetical protein
MGNAANDGTGGISTSTDGLTWTLRTTTNIASNPSTVADCDFGNGYYVAVGENNGTHNSFYSTDGLTWTAFTSNSSSSYYQVYYTGTNWIMYGASTTPTRYRASSPVGSWSTWSNNFSVVRNSFQGQFSSNYQAEYDSKFYQATVGGTSANYLINFWSKGSTGTHTTTFYSPINNLPGFPRTTNSTQLSLNAIALSSTGQYLLGDSAGRIWTSF